MAMNGRDVDAQREIDLCDRERNRAADRGDGVFERLWQTLADLWTERDRHRGSADGKTRTEWFCKKLAALVHILLTDERVRGGFVACVNFRHDKLMTGPWVKRLDDFEGTLRDMADRAQETAGKGGLAKLLKEGKWHAPGDGGKVGVVDCLRLRADWLSEARQGGWLNDTIERVRVILLELRHMPRNLCEEARKIEEAHRIWAKRLRALANGKWLPAVKKLGQMVEELDSEVVVPAQELNGAVQAEHLTEAYLAFFPKAEQAAKAVRWSKDRRDPMVNRTVFDPRAGWKEKEEEELLRDARRVLEVLEDDAVEALVPPKGSGRKHRSDSRNRLTAKFRREFVRNYCKEHRWNGTLRELKKALKKEGPGFDVSITTLCRYLKDEPRVMGQPRRAAEAARKEKGHSEEREAAVDEGPADLSDMDAWTMPDDPDDE